jgi:hypothetical protein
VGDGAVRVGLDLWEWEVGKQTDHEYMNKYNSLGLPAARVQSNCRGESLLERLAAEVVQLCHTVLPARLHCTGSRHTGWPSDLAEPNPDADLTA